MPKVGSKHYAYTPKGIAMAKSAAKKMGTKLKMSVGGHIGNLGFKTVDNLKKGKKVAGAIKDEMVDPIRKFIKERNIKILKDSLQKEYMKTVKDRKRRG